MRSTGVLMPIFSLPSPYGIGTLGASARAFIDFLAQGGQKWWQVLPIGPTGYGDSPYQSFSSFAGNPYFVDPDQLVEKGLLTQEECQEFDFGNDSSRIDYGKLYLHRPKLLWLASSRFNFSDWDYQTFCYHYDWWLEDYALFMALKGFHRMVSFQEWGEDYRLRRPKALEVFRREHNHEIDFWKFIQYQFWTQWEALHTYAQTKGLGIIGDIPIYVALDSADVWAQPHLFHLDEELCPIQVAGCPPDAFSASGQLWGNPLYLWDTHQETGFAWWIERMQAAARAYDIIRIDHFRGFESFYSIPAQNKDARNGLWKKGPGMALISAIQRELPNIQIIAEDLGFLTPQVAQLLADSGFPGMKVLQFAFDSREASDYLPHNYGHNSVVYTGTHDNTTTAHWGVSAPSTDVAFAREYMGVGRDDDLTEAFVRTALASVCDLAIIPFQDYLGLGEVGRINAPSTLGGNWIWRAEEERFSPALAKKMARMAKIYGRISKNPEPENTTK